MRTLSYGVSREPAQCRLSELRRRRTVRPVAAGNTGPSINGTQSGTGESCPLKGRALTSNKRLLLAVYSETRQKKSSYVRLNVYLEGPTALEQKKDQLILRPNTCFGNSFLYLLFTRVHSRTYYASSRPYQSAGTSVFTAITS